MSFEIGDDVKVLTLMLFLFLRMNKRNLICILD